jgi:class 3 adenylate cyclase
MTIAHSHEAVEEWLSRQRMMNMGALASTHTGDPGRSDDLAQGFQRLWRHTIRNEILGSAISVLPAMIFYYAAFSYTATQFKALLKLTPLPVAAFLAVDLALNWWYLAPFRRLSRTAPLPPEISRVYTRLHNLPIFSFIRVFGPHALAASAAAQIGVFYANAHWGLGMPRSDYWIYWLLNFMLVPIGHAIFEYHANGWAAREALTGLASHFPLPRDSRGVWRVGLATRLAVFYTLLAISPLVLLAVAAQLHPFRAATPGMGSDVVKVVAGVVSLNLILLILFAWDVNQQTGVLLLGLQRVEEGDFSRRVDLFTPDEFGVITEGINKMIHGLGERQRLRDLFGVYLSPEVSRAILEGRIALQGEARMVSILFCDIREFTRFSAAHSPREVVSRLNRFFGSMAGAIRGQAGTVNKFLGDGFLAVFGAPVHYPDHARRAVEAALQMERQLAALNDELTSLGQPPLEIGIGIDSGEVIAGNVGSADRLEYTVIGDAVNRSSRIEQLNKSLGTRILVSGRTYQDSLVEGGRALTAVTVKGIDEPIRLFTVGSKV